MLKIQMQSFPSNQLKPDKLLLWCFRVQLVPISAIFRTFQKKLFCHQQKNWYNSGNCVNCINYLLSYYSIPFRKSMKKNESKSVYDPTTNKKRPSIQFSPTLQKPVYIITKNLNGPHIIDLVEALDKHKIPYQMQQETQTLGFKLNQRFFVIVDNKYGEVTLGPQFGSILMTVVGYPRIGKNKKNKYFQKTSEIVNFYEVFKNNRDISERQKSLINKEYSDIIMEKGDSNSKIKSKIMVRSISKYKGPQKDSFVKNSEIVPSKYSKKLYVIQDKSSEPYSRLCDQLQTLVNKELVQKAGSVEEIRKKTLFPTARMDVFYLVNQKYEKELLDSIFIGEVIVFNSEIAAHNLKNAFAQPKIYGISSEQKEIFKMLQNIGFLAKEESHLLISKLPETSSLNSDKHKVSQQAKEVEEKKPEKPAQIEKKEVTTEQVSKIEGMLSVISENVKQNDLNTSQISQASTKSKRIKRVNKKKPNNNQLTIVESQYFTGTKQNVTPKISIQLNGVRMKTLKIQENQSQINKSKKTLKLNEPTPDPSKIKKVRSLSRFQPKQIHVFTESNATMTQSEYFHNQFKIIKPSLPTKIRNSSSITSKSSNLSQYLKVSKNVNAIFYRQFIHSFNQAVQIIKAKPSLFFSQPTKSQIYQPFFNMTEFDRFAKRIKRKIKESGNNSQQFHFLVFLIEEQLPAFEKYCFEKNKSYEEQGYEMQGIMKATNFSSTFTSTKIPKLTIYLFVQSDSPVQQKSLTFGNIKLLEFAFPKATGHENLEKSLHQIQQKLAINESTETRDYYHS